MSKKNFVLVLKAKKQSAWLHRKAIFSHIVRQPIVIRKDIKQCREQVKTFIKGKMVTAIYSDGSSKVINNYNCFPITELSTSNSTITISYTENGKTVTATLPIEVRAKNTNNNDKNDTNKDVTNENANNSTNIIQIKDKNTDVNSNKITKDNTTKDGKIASTGGETYIIPIIVIAVIGAFGFVKYRQYKDI